jgi:hypothetical protein
VFRVSRRGPGRYPLISFTTLSPTDPIRSLGGGTRWVRLHFAYLSRFQAAVDAPHRFDDSSGGPLHAFNAHQHFGPVSLRLVDGGFQPIHPNYQRPDHQGVEGQDAGEQHADGGYSQAGHVTPLLQ